MKRHSPSLTWKYYYVIFAFIMTLLTANGESSDIPESTWQKPVRVYLLVGQSNMAGRGSIETIDTQTHPRVLSLGSQDTWVVAQEPLHFDKAGRGVGPGLAFGKAMAEAHPDEIICLVPCAVGGTLVSYWLPDAPEGLFNEAVRRAKIATKDHELSGILWQQGESDRFADRPAHYQERLEVVLNSFREQLNPDTPIVIGGLGDFLKGGKPKRVNNALQQTADALPRTIFSPASDAGHIGDNLHFNSEAQRENGRNMARAMQKLEGNTHDNN